MSFEQLHKRISPTLKRIAYRLSGHFTFFNDEDLYQEASAHLWQEFSAGRLLDKTDSYILQGCYFHLKNHIRKVRPKAVLVSIEECVYQNKEDGRREEAQCLGRDGVKAYLENIDARLLADTIRNNGLSPREKVIISFCSEGLTMRQIGARLGVSHVAVVKSLGLIRAKCRKYLDHP